jgi:hypothetical protein
MSLVLCGPRRTYVCLFFCRRVGRGCASCPGRRSAGDPAPPAELDPFRPYTPAPARLIASIRLQRLLWRWFVGLTVIVVDATR